MVKSIPGPKRTSPLGILLAFQRDPLGLMMGLHRDYGRIVQAPGPFGIKMVSITASEMVQEVLVNQVHKLEKPAPLKQIFRSSFGNGLFFSEGDFWKRQRKLVQPAFHHGRLGIYSERIVKHTAAMLDSWRGQKGVMLRKQMNALTLTVVVDAIFHNDVQAETEPIYHAMHALGEAIGKQSTNLLLAGLPDTFPLPLLRRKRQASKMLHATIDRFIQQRRTAGETSGDLLSSLIFACDADTGEAMLDRQVRDEVMTLFIAGHETSSAIMTAIFVLLAQHPEVEAALHQELDAVIGARLPTHDDLSKLLFTRKVIKEALRLYPAAWLLLRQVIEPVTVGGYTVPRGNQLWVSPYVIHRDPEYYDQPEAFNPHRWTDEFEGSLPRYAYMPFGAGPRICIGNGFAIQEMNLMLATIASQVRLSLPPDAVPEFRGVPTLSLIGEVPMFIEARRG